MLRRITKLALLATMLATVFSACGGSVGLPGTAVALRTAQAKVHACDMALLAGELVASNKSGLAVRGPDGVTEVLWPFGYTATRETSGLVLRDETGKILVHEGQRVSMAGGADANGVWKACGGSVQEVSNTGG